MVLNKETKEKINKLVKNSWPKNGKQIDKIAKAFISIDGMEWLEKNQDKPNFKNEFKAMYINIYEIITSELSRKLIKEINKKFK